MHKLHLARLSPRVAVGLMPETRLRPARKGRMIAADRRVARLNRSMGYALGRALCGSPHAQAMTTREPHRESGEVVVPSCFLSENRCPLFRKHSSSVVLLVRKPVPTFPEALLRRLPAVWDVCVGLRRGTSRGGTVKHTTQPCRYRSEFHIGLNEKTAASSVSTCTSTACICSAPKTWSARRAGARFR